MRLIKRTSEVFQKEGFAGIMRHARRKISGWIDPDSVLPPPSPEAVSVQMELDRIAMEMRALLNVTSYTPLDQDAEKLCAQFAPWFQRIDLGNGVVTTGDPSRAVYDNDRTSSLGYRLTPQQSAQLRPLPKWMFIRSRLPEIRGNTVLEIGSNCGFFSFEFAKLGADQVIGVEILNEYVTRAEALRDVMGLRQVEFLRRDWCLDETPGKYDIVFTSDALPHMMFPFIGLYRVLTSAKKLAIIDAGVHWTKQPSMNFYFEQGYTRYHAFVFSDSLMMGYMIRCGVPADAIVQHPYGRKRCLYVIDVSKANLSPTILSGDDLLWSGKFTFDRGAQATYHE